MTVAYVLIFLTLFAIIGDGFVQKYFHHKINNYYSTPRYEAYVHRRRPHMNSGLNMRSLVNGDEPYCQIFEELILYVYQKAPFYHEGLAKDLLTLFQKNITFNQNDVEKGKHLFKEIDDLDTLFIADEQLEQAYLFFIRGSTTSKDDLSGYPSLKTFFYGKDDKSQAPKLNLFDMPLQLIGAMFKEKAEEDIRELRATWADSEPTSQEEQLIVDRFITTHRLSTHKYHNLVDFKIRSD